MQAQAFPSQVLQDTCFIPMFTLSKRHNQRRSACTASDHLRALTSSPPHGWQSSSFASKARYLNAYCDPSIRLSATTSRMAPALRIGQALKGLKDTYLLTKQLHDTVWTASYLYSDRVPICFADIDRTHYPRPRRGQDSTHKPPKS